MDFGVPEEVGGEGEVDAEEGAGDGLDLGGELEFGETVHETVHELPGVGEIDEFPDFGRGEVEVAVPGELFAFGFADDFLGDAFELAEGGH